MIFFETIYSRPAHSRASLSLVFYFENIFKDLDSGRYSVENILLFIPEGFLWSGIFSKKMRYLKIVLISFASSLAIEITQLLTGRGYFQISDLATNTAGGFLGSVAFTVISVVLLWFYSLKSANSVSDNNGK